MRHSRTSLPRVGTAIKRDTNARTRRRLDSIKPKYEAESLAEGGYLKALEFGAARRPLPEFADVLATTLLIEHQYSDASRAGSVPASCERHADSLIYFLSPICNYM